MDIVTKRTLAELAKIQGGKFALNQFARICNNPKFVHFNNPFSCPDSIPDLLIDAVIGANKATENRNSVLKNAKSHGLVDFCEALESPEFVKFAFLRDPVERFCAIYEDKFGKNALPNDPKTKLFEFLDIADESELSLGELAKIVANSELDRDRIAFLRPQRNIIAYDYVEFDFLGNTDHWLDDIKHIFQDFLLLDWDDKFASRATPMPQMPEVDAETHRNLERAYLRDFEMLEENHFY